MTDDGRPIPRLPDAVAVDATPTSTRISYHDALRAAHQVHASAMGSSRRKHRDEFAMAGGFVMLALLVGGFLLVNHFVWSADDAQGTASYDLQTVDFTTRLPLEPTTSEFSTMVAGSLTNVSEWRAGSATSGVTVWQLDNTLTTPGDAADAARVTALLKAGHEQVLAWATERVNGTVQSTLAAKVNGDAALTSEVGGGDTHVFVTTVIHGLTVVSVECDTSSASPPGDCTAAVDHLQLR